MTMRSRRLTAISGMSIAVLALAACSGGGGGGGAPTPNTSGAPWNGKAIATSTIAMPAQTTSFDPAASVSATDRVAAALMFGSLFVLDGTGKVTPSIATGVTYTDDFTGATVKMRDADFSDGSPITAADVVATIEREQAIKTSVLAGTTGHIKTVKAEDDHTVGFTFTTAYPSFAGDAGLLSIYPAAELKDAAAYYKAPTVTSGQYTSDGGWSSNTLRLKANPKYFGAQPAVTDVTLSVVADGNAAISQLQSGQIDYAGDLAPNYATQVATSPGLRVEPANVFGFYDVRLNNAKGVFKDVAVRKAVNTAIDRDAIVKAIWGRYNAPLAGFWPKGMDGHDDSVKTAVDLDAAKALLRGTACASGCTVKMIYSDQDFAFSSQLVLMLQEQLGKIGIKVQLEKVDGATIVDRLFAGTFDLCPGAMLSNGNTPDQILTLALNGKGPLHAEFTGYDSPAMDALVAKAITGSGADRSAAAAAIEKQFQADQPLVTLATWVRMNVSRIPDGAFELTGPSALMSSVK